MEFPFMNSDHCRSHQTPCRFSAILIESKKWRHLEFRTERTQFAQGLKQLPAGNALVRNLDSGKICDRHTTAIISLTLTHQYVISKMPILIGDTHWRYSDTLIPPLTRMMYHIVFWQLGLVPPNPSLMRFEVALIAVARDSWIEKSGIDGIEELPRGSV